MDTKEEKKELEDTGEENKDKPREKQLKEDIIRDDKKDEEKHTDDREKDELDDRKKLEDDEEADSDDDEEKSHFELHQLQSDAIMHLKQRIEELEKKISGAKEEAPRRKWTKEDFD